MELFLDYTPGANVAKNQYLAGLLMLYPQLFHGTAWHNLVIKTSQRLPIKENHRKRLG